jgi:hypothetical protein
MWNIAAQETLAESIVEQGGVEHVLKSMKSISNAPRIHWLGCAVLINLVRNGAIWFPLGFLFFETILMCLL